MVQYFDEMNQKSDVMSKYVNELIGDSLCSWLQIDDIKIETTSSPIYFDGNKVWFSSIQLKSYRIVLKL
jgi:hypothetical protein